MERDRHFIPRQTSFENIGLVLRGGNSKISQTWIHEFAIQLEKSGAYILSISDREFITTRLTQAILQAEEREMYLQLHNRIYTYNIFVPITKIKTNYQRNIGKFKAKQSINHCSFIRVYHRQSLSLR